MASQGLYSYYDGMYMNWLAGPSITAAHHAHPPAPNGPSAPSTGPYPEEAVSKYLRYQQEQTKPSLRARTFAEILETFPAKRPAKATAKKEQQAALIDETGPVKKIDDSKEWEYDPTKPTYLFKIPPELRNRKPHHPRPPSRSTH